MEVGLDALIELPEFTKALHEEVQARGLVLEDVSTCAKSIYFRLLYHKYDLDKTIVISDMDFTAEERAALVTFMRVQSKWRIQELPWREEVSGKLDKWNVLDSSL